MKNLLLLLVIHLQLSVFSQTGIQTSHEITYNNKTREYILYIPQSYTGEDKVPLLLNLHGYTSNMTQHIFFADFRKIADTASFIIVVPNGLNNPITGQQQWNYFDTQGEDDLGFLSSLLDNIIENYAINTDRVYSTGMSNGGFMSLFLACNLSEKITAVASVTGSMLKSPITECTLSHPMPVMLIHGTADLIVPYNGNSNFESIPNVINYWAAKSNCSTTPVISNIPNTNLSDGTTVEYYVYPNGDNGTSIEHFKIIGGGHSWPGSIVTLPLTNYDIDASVEIWRFFNKYTTSKLLKTDEETDTSLNIKIYPNPSNGNFKISGKHPLSQVKIINISGETVRQFINTEQGISIENLPAGMYFIQIQAMEQIHYKKVIINN